MCIFKPHIVEKKVSTRSGDMEHGAEIYILSDDDIPYLNNKEYFKIKLAYNGHNHYVPVVPKDVSGFLDQHNNARYYIQEAKKAVQKLSSHLPKESNYRGLVDIGFKALTATATTFSKFNPLLGTTGTAGAATPADFGFPVSGSPGQHPPPSKKRKTAASQPEEEEEEEEDEGEELQDLSPQITITHDRELKKADLQCFCGKSDFKTLDELAHHRADVHIVAGQINPKTKKPKENWQCSQCGEVCSDNRATWKHFRTQHLGLFVHYCPVEGCSTGNDQKDSIVSHILKEHSDQQEWVAKCHQQEFLKCSKCAKFFRSLKGKNKHERECGIPVIKLNCVYKGCTKTYKTQEKMQEHVATAHQGKGHKCICPVCGKSLGSEQNLTKHLKSQHNQ